MLGVGHAEFIRKWGDRKNTDYWRVSSKAIELQNQQEDSAAAAKDSAETVKKWPPLFASGVPTSRSVLIAPFSNPFWSGPAEMHSYFHKTSRQTAWRKLPRCLQNQVGDGHVAPAAECRTGWNASPRECRLPSSPSDGC